MSSDQLAATTIYTHPDCPYSAAAKADFAKLQIEFHEIDVSINHGAIEDLEKLTGGERITPVIVEGDNVTIGYYGVG